MSHDPRLCKHCAEELTDLRNAIEFVLGEIHPEDAEDLLAILRGEE